MSSSLPETRLDPEDLFISQSIPLFFSVLQFLLMQIWRRTTSVREFYEEKQGKQNWLGYQEFLLKLFLTLISFFSVPSEASLSVKSVCWSVKLTYLISSLFKLFLYLDYFFSFRTSKKLSLCCFDFFKAFDSR